MTIQTVARTFNGIYEPDPVKRIHNAYCELRLPELPKIDVESFFKKIPGDFQPIKAAQTGYGARYGEF